VPFGRFRPEAILEAFEKDLRQRDLGQQDQYLFSALDRRGDRFEIDLRLARAGDAVDQRHAEFSSFDSAAQRRPCLFLLAAQFIRAIGRIGRRHDRARRDHFMGQHALRLQPVDDGRRYAGGVGKP
jgi:hypothetical protein